MFNPFTDPKYYMQAEDKGNNPLHKNLLRAKEQRPKQGAPKVETKVVSDLLYSLNHTPHALAVAANQRGWEVPIFSSRWDLETLNNLPVSADLDAKHQHYLSCATNLTVYKNPSYTQVIEDGTVFTEESCLSWEGRTGLMERFNTIDVSVEVLDLWARKGNRSRNVWNKKSFRLSGLAAQIFQHEYDHLIGLGIWNMREI